MKRILMVLAATVICGAALSTACTHNGKTDAKKPPAREYVCDDDIDAHDHTRWLRDHSGDTVSEYYFIKWINYGLD